MKKKALAAFAAALLMTLSLLTGCGSVVAAAPEETTALVTARNDTSSGSGTAAPEVVSAAEAEVDVSVSDRDASGEYDASSAVSLTPEDDLTITEAGVYLLSGTYENKMLVIEVGDEDKVQLVLENAVLTNENGPAIYVRSADKVFITAAEGTENVISDGADYAVTDGDTELDAAVFSKEDLTLNGAGKLTINGNCKHAVVSKDDLVVTAKALTVNAENAGLCGKDSVRVSGASVQITAGSDGIRSDNDEDAEKGYVGVTDSSLTIVSGKDGIQAETVFTSADSAITVTAGGGSSARSADASESYKGIKAGTALTVSGGTMQIDALDDALHTNGSILIEAGSFTLYSGDDGIHGDELVEIAGGTFRIAAHEGIEGTYVLIRGGEIDIQASDDGINAARKSTAWTPTVEISGGTVTITMGAGDTDGIDSNGNILITGGTISVNGSSAFDYDGTATFTGGTVYVNGQQVTTLSNQMMGGGMGGFGGQGGFPGGQGGGPGGQGGFPGGQGGFGGKGGGRP